MNKDFAPLAVEGVDPWDGIEIEPTVRRLAEQAAQAAGLTVEAWLERAVRQACAAVLPVAPVVGRGLDQGHGALRDEGEATIAAAPVGRWAMDIADTLPAAPAARPPKDQPAEAEPAPDLPLPPVIADEAWDPAPVNALPDRPPPAPEFTSPKGKPSWTIIERLAQQQTTRRAPMRLVRKDPDAPAEASATPLPKLPPEDPFIPATPLMTDAAATMSFDEHLAGTDAGTAVGPRSPRVMRQPLRHETSHVAPSGWRQWLLMGGSCLAALVAGMIIAPLIFRASPPDDTSRHVTVDLTPASQMVAEQPKRPADIAPPPAVTPPAAAPPSVTPPPAAPRPPPRWSPLPPRPKRPRPPRRRRWCRRPPRLRRSRCRQPRCRWRRCRQPSRPPRPRRQGLPRRTGLRPTH